MAAYVDDMRMYAEVPNGRGVVKGRWSHLTADTPDELHTFALALGLKRSWFQPAKLFPDNAYNRERGQVGAMRSRFHYDVTDRVRSEAIVLGAVALVYGSERWMDLFAHNWREDKQHIAVAVGRRTAEENRRLLAMAEAAVPPLFRVDSPRDAAPTQAPSRPILLPGEHEPC